MFNLQQKSSSCDKIIHGWNLFNEEYNAKVAFIKNTILAESSINARIDNWAAQIEIATEEAATLYDDSVQMGQWRAAINDLKSYLEYARNN